MSNEAMRLALEALENINSADNNQDFLSPKERLDLCNAIIALWKALAEQPAQRTWVGLTNDEVNNLAAGCHLGKSVQDAIYEADAKLKEKNT